MTAIFQSRVKDCIDRAEAPIVNGEDAQHVQKNKLGVYNNGRTPTSYCPALGGLQIP